MPDGLDAAEFDRQLREQMSVINNMTADDMGYAHSVLRQMRKDGLTTEVIRDRVAQQNHRRAYEDILERSGTMSPEEIRQHMARVQATHSLDMVAGGDPRYFSHDARGNPVLGGGRENEAIGRQWRGARANSLADEAERMRRDGRAVDKMSVELKRC